MEPFGNMQSEENDKVVLLYKLYYKQMLYAAKQILRDHCEAENAAQEAFLGLASHLDKIEDVHKRESFYYVIRAARNAAINLLHTNKKWMEYEPLERVIGLPAGSPTAEWEIREQYDRVLSHIERMKPCYREVLYLYFVKEHSASEISCLLNLKLSTVKQRLVRGKKELLARIGSEPE